MKRPIKIYTDGSSSPHQKNPDAQYAGWAICLVFENVDYVYYGQLPAPATNNMAEMMALTFALEISSNMVSQTFTDNQYSIDSLVKWRKKWEQHGLPEKNRELIRRLWQVFDERTATVDIRWIKGHAGFHYNEVADQYAKKGKLGDIKSGQLGRVKYMGFKTPEDFIAFVQRTKNGDNNS
ncbi:RNase H [Vibrio phage 1.244.A._10N.261.54.C3]|nr:RNase H [Vibrio phage 1.244.A._10N.261.54.C3]AUR98660.1 RNase H [Vibrio phage 1.255.O._10N.286.45.F1]